MERLYELRARGHPDLVPFIATETVGDRDGFHAGLLTVEEVLAMPGGADALEAWRAGYDHILEEVVQRDILIASAEDIAFGRCKR